MYPNLDCVGCRENHKKYEREVPCDNGKCKYPIVELTERNLRDLILINEMEMFGFEAVNSLREIKLNEEEATLFLAKWRMIKQYQKSLLDKEIEDSKKKRGRNARNPNTR